MRIRWLYLIIIWCFISGCLSTPKRQALIPHIDQVNHTTAQLQKIRSFDDIRNLSDNDFDLAQAVLFISEKAQPGIDKQKYLSMIDQLSAELSYHVKSRRSGKAQASLIADFIWQKGFISEQPYWMNFRTNMFYEMWNLDYSNFIALLDTQKGNCMTFSLLYLILAQRAGLPLYGVVMPSHIFVRFDDGSYRCNIETTDNGYIVSDESYVRAMDDDFDYLESCDDEFMERFGSYYLTNLTRKQVLACFLMNLAMVRINHGNVDDGLQLLLLANQCNPRDPDILNNLGNTLKRKNRHALALDAYRRQLSATPFKAQAYYNIGSAYKEMDDLPQAKRFFKEATVQKSYVFYDYWSVCMALYELGEYDTAMKQLDKIIYFDKGHCRAWYYKARVLTQLQKYDQAIECLSQAFIANTISKKWAQTDPVFTPIYSNERFRKLTSQ